MTTAAPAVIGKPLPRSRAWTAGGRKPTVRSQILLQVICLFITATVLFPILWIFSLAIDPRNLSRPTVLMLPAVATIAPLFIMLNSVRIDLPILGQFNLRQSLLGVGLAVVSGALPFAIWNLKGYLDTIPKELEEAAAVDGCTRNQSFFR